MSNLMEQVNYVGTSKSTRTIPTAFFVYSKIGTTPQISLQSFVYNNSKIYVVKAKINENTRLCTSYYGKRMWLCDMESTWMKNNGWQAIAGMNAGFFIDNSKSADNGMPIGAVLVDWAGKWSQFNATELVPAKGNGYPSLCFDDENMTLVDAYAPEFDLSKYHWIQGVGQSLVINSKINTTVGTQNGRYNSKVNASAIGWIKSTKEVVFMINAKNGTYAGTLNTPERAQVMKDLGCSLAVQLDGGGSSQLQWLKSALTANTEASEAQGTSTTDRMVVGMHHWNVTQGGASMTGKKNYSHPAYELDLAGEDTGIDFWFNKMPNTYWYCAGAGYAPYNTSGTRFYWSCDAKGNKKAVMCADGKMRVLTLAMTHSGKAYPVGTIIKPGQEMYREGTKAASGVKVTGNHIHLEICEGWVKTKVKNSMGYYNLANMLDPRKVLFIWDKFTTVKGSGGFKWTHCSEVTV